jgi:4-hydroxyproline epimerase
MDHPLQIIDSHTEGEPTRTIVNGFPELRGSTMAEMRDDFKSRFDHLRTGLINEPRGHAAIVGALVTPPVTAGADAGVIFFNDAGYLGMCGHGTMGVAQTLRYLGRTDGEAVTLDTPVGRVQATFEGRRITIRNIPCRSLGHRSIEGLTGEVAYGGNWFFLIEHPLDDLVPENLDRLLVLTKEMRADLAKHGITGDQGEVVDHVELFAKTPQGAKNFVLCPGGAYDRSPCGTGTSAKLACLAASGALAPGEPFEIESITGGRFSARYTIEGGLVIPWITGRAFVTSHLEPVFEAEDPFRFGL